ncbi:hypothetical protein Clacol_004934 [Clathrus columnatus]|uniref:Laccase n=1 Tax=Clathrus columnatus TaxID=1419009 RepID=A0AAV5AAV5_9AGAM|nr:hypothetical protein Clacol_004934 [Clathrus columnatus]
MRLLTKSFPCTLLSLVGLSQAAVVSHQWTLSNKDISPDGFTRSAALVNGQYPGPLLQFNKGDTGLITVNNHLTDPTMRRSSSIHWHGIFQHRNAENDGPSFVTQCPISPNHSYTYQIALGQQTGTFWYHSHLSTQYVDGIRGPIVIYDPNDPNKNLYDVDDATTVITLTDWYHDTAFNLENAWFAGGPEPVPDSGLINSAGRYENGPLVPLTRINVQRGKRYRLRIVSASANGFFDVSIQNHRMTIIEADGIAVKPYVVDSLQILPAQRYSVVITANQTVDNYWFSATQTVRGATTASTNPNFNGSDTFAVLHYAGASSGEPTSSQVFSSGPVAFNESQLVPLINPGAPGGSSPPDQVFNFTFGTNTSNGDVWLINGIQYQSPSVPTLLNILTHANATFGTNEHTLTLLPNAIIEVSFIGTAGHAFHLHGHTFDVIQSASGGAPNYINPPRRDTVSSGGTATAPVRIRFRTDNPEAGLAAVFAEDPSGIRSGPQSVNPDPQWGQLCNIYNQLPDDLK